MPKLMSGTLIPPPYKRSWLSAHARGHHNLTFALMPFILAYCTSAVITTTTK